MKLEKTEGRLRFHVEWILLLSLTAVAIWLRFYNLGDLGLWGDEGFTYLAVDGILKEGVPRLPSNHILYNNLLFTYLSSLPALLGGVNEFTVRFVSAAFGVAIVPLFYFVGKKFFPAWLAFLGALILTLSHWEIEFARHARYYCQLQFFYFLALYYFYKGFIEEKHSCRLWAFLFFVLAALSHQLGYTLVFCFLALLWIKGVRALFQRPVMVYAFLYAAVACFMQFFEIFVWQVGSVTHMREELSIWEILFRDFHFGFFKEFVWLFPRMSWIAAIGAAVILLRRKNPLSFFIVMGLLCLIFLGFGQAHIQPRYVFSLVPLFIFAYLAGLVLVFNATKKIFGWFGLKGGGTVGLSLASLLFLGTLDGSHPKYSFEIPTHHYGKRLNEKIQSSTTFRRRVDYKTPGEYVRKHSNPQDIILGMHTIFHTIYAGRCDYWLWSGSKEAWDAFYEKEGKVLDRHVGIPLIQNLEEFKAFLKKSKGRVWVITSPSIYDRELIEPRLAQFLKDQTEKIQFHGLDGMSKVLLFTSNDIEE